MANKIKTTVLDNHGNSYASDVYVQHDANINSAILADLRVPISMLFFKSHAHKDAGYSPFAPIVDTDKKIPISVFFKEITPEEAASLNAIAVQNYVTEYLSEIYGKDNVETV